MFVQLIFLALDTKSGIMMWRRRGETWKTSCRTWRKFPSIESLIDIFMGTSGNQYSAAIDVFSEWSDEVNSQRCPVSSFGHLPDLLCVPLPSLQKISIIDCDGSSDTNEDVPPPLMQHHLHTLCINGVYEYPGRDILDWLAPLLWACPPRAESHLGCPRRFPTRPRRWVSAHTRPHLRLGVRTIDYGGTTCLWRFDPSIAEPNSKEVFTFDVDLGNNTMLRSLEFHSEFLSIETVPYISRSIWTIRRRSAPLIWKKWHLFKFTKTTYYSTRRLRRECRRWLLKPPSGSACRSVVNVDSFKSFLENNLSLKLDRLIHFG